MVNCGKYVLSQSVNQSITSVGGLFGVLCIEALMEMGGETR